MLNAYCNALHPRNGQLRDAKCYWKIDGRDLVEFTFTCDNNYWALHEAVTRLLDWSITESQPLTIHVVNKAIPQNRDLIRLCGKSGSELVWLPKEQYLIQCPEAPESERSTVLGRNDVTRDINSASL